MGYESIRQQGGAGGKGSLGPAEEGSAWNPFNDFMGDLKSMIASTRPDLVDTAGNAFSGCASNMERTATLLYDAAKRLSDHWQGDAADAALKKLQEMYKACQEIHEAAQPSGAALEVQASVLRKYKSIVEGAGGVNAAGITTALVTLPTGLVVTAGAANQIYNNKHAQQLMQDLNEDTRASNDRFPMHMRTDLPARTDVSERIPDTGKPPGIGTGGGGAGGGTGAFPKSNFPDGSGGPGFPKGTGSGGEPSIGAFPGGEGGPGAFPGSPSSGGLPDTAFPGAGGAGAGTGLAGFNPGAGGTGGGLGAGAGGMGSSDPFGAGVGGGLSTGAGAAGSGGGLAGGLGGASGGRGAAGRGMMPMAPHAGGQGDDKERERSTWLTEDEDVWNTGDDAAPPVIG